MLNANRAARAGGHRFSIWNHRFAGKGLEQRDLIVSDADRNQPTRE